MRTLRQSIWMVITLVLVGTAQHGQAGNVQWTGGSGSWTNGANWDSGNIPSGTDQPIIDNGGTATIDSPVGISTRINLGRTANHTGTVVMASGGSVTNMVWGDQRIGDEGVGIVLQNGGTWNGAGKYLNFGSAPGGSGTWTMTDGVLSNCVMYIGHNNSQGRFEMTGASALVEGLANNTYVGYTNNANGVVIQSNGTWDNNGKRLYLGYDTGATGTWTMTGGVLTNCNNIRIGNSANGRFELGGTALVAGCGEPAVGYHAGSTGTVVQTGGTWDNNNQQIRIGEDAGAVGSWQISGGVLTNADIIHVGFDGSGTIELSGSGEIQLGSVMRIGSKSGSTGTLIQTGGTLNGNNSQCVIADQAGSTGSYQISGGSITNVSQLHCGSAGTGTLHIAGADASINAGTFIMGSTDDTLSIVPDAGGITPINASGAITLTGTLEVDFENYDLHSSELVLINCGSRGGTFASTNLTAEWSATVDYSQTQIKLTNIKGPPTGFVMTIY